MSWRSKNVELQCICHWEILAPSQGRDRRSHNGDGKEKEKEAPIASSLQGNMSKTRGQHSRHSGTWIFTVWWTQHQTFSRICVWPGQCFVFCLQVDEFVPLDWNVHFPSFLDGSVSRMFWYKVRYISRKRTSRILILAGYLVMTLCTVFKPSSPKCFNMRSVYLGWHSWSWKSVTQLFVDLDSSLFRLP